MGSNVGGAIDVELHDVANSKGQQVNLCGPGNALTALGLVPLEFLPLMLTGLHASIASTKSLVPFRAGSHPILVAHDCRRFESDDFLSKRYNPTPCSPFSPSLAS